jgi:hypothetical protein
MEINMRDVYLGNLMFAVTDLRSMFLRLKELLFSDVTVDAFL